MLATRTTWSMPVTIAVTVATVTIGANPAQAQPSGPTTSVPIDGCPALYALGIQGTGESSPDAAPTTDTGMLSSVFVPMLAAAPESGVVARAYVPYESSFGGAVSGGRAPYAESLTQGLSRLRAMAGQLAQRCPQTRFAVAGYSQGAHVASLFAQEVGAGRGVVAPERVAAVALLADPTRNPGAALFPGAPGRTVPDEVPETAGAQVAAVQTLPRRPVAGGGIGPERDRASDFGALTGRVASFCEAGDLVCDAPAGAPIVRAVTNIAGRSTLAGVDPVAALQSIAQALAFTSIKTAASVANSDVRGNTPASLSYRPQQSISQRLAEASDPRSDVAPTDSTDTGVSGRGADPMHGLLRAGSLGLNAVGTAVRTVLDPAALGELARAALYDPPVALQTFARRLTGAVAQPVPPTTVSRLTDEAFDAVVHNITDNRDLLDTTTWVRYWDTVQRHGAYATAAVDASGDAPVRFVADWFAAAARDLVAAHGTPQPPKGASSSPVTGILVPPSGASRAPNSSGTGQFPFGTGPGAAPTVSTTPGTTHDYPFSTH